MEQPGSMRPSRVVGVETTAFSGRRLRYFISRGCVQVETLGRALADLSDGAGRIQALQRQVGGAAFSPERPKGWRRAHGRLTDSLKGSFRAFFPRFGLAGPQPGRVG